MLGEEARPHPTPEQSLPEAIQSPQLPSYSDEKVLSVGSNDKEVVIPTDKEVPPALPPEKIVASEAPVSSPTPTGRRIFGLRRPTFFLLLLLLVAIVVGAVVGGVVGSRQANGNDGSASAESLTSSATLQSATNTAQATSSAPPTGSAIPTASSTSATSTPTSATTPVSLAAAVCDSPSHVQLFALFDRNSSIEAHVKGDNGWKSLGALDLDNTPRIGTPISAISWVQDGDDQVRLYFIDTQNRIIEQAGRCRDDGTSCTWNGASTVLTDATTPDVSPTSGLTAIHWGNKTLNGNNIHLFYVSTDGGLVKLAYAPGEWAVLEGPSPQVLSNTSLAAAISPLFEPVFISLVYDVSSQPSVNTETAGNVSTLYVGVEGSSQSKFAITSIPSSTNGAAPDTHLYSIDSGSRVTQQIYDSHGQAENSESAETLDINMADNSYGPIAAVSAVDADETQEWLFYIVDGSVREMIGSGGGWTSGATLH